MADFPYTTPLDKAALDQLFTEARTINAWRDTPVSDQQLQHLYDLTKMGPTSANCSPARFYFVKSEEAKLKLKPLLMAGNDEKMMQAPVTVIIANDMAFADKIPELFPHNPDAKNWFADSGVAAETAMRNGTLQGGYLMLAARSIGLHCGPMSGFDAAGVDAAFFAGTQYRSNFICTLGYGKTEDIFPRSPRLSFADAAKIL
ncbi:malonic semialdehyde reductase [Kordiimonas aquimaris]|uniref:malonic semialdehyde reductase n=1 Tax=Kordiimonas aquimaris TaxID=707591 RepID=UPI0021CEC4B4|nr:malonic semialdehyde reductase [Kordiimonas aquimaris]